MVEGSSIASFTFNWSNRSQLRCFFKDLSKIVESPRPLNTRIRLITLYLIRNISTLEQLNLFLTIFEQQTGQRFLELKYGGIDQCIQALFKRKHYLGKQFAESVRGKPKSWQAYLLGETSKKSAVVKRAGIRNPKKKTEWTGPISFTDLGVPTPDEQLALVMRAKNNDQMAWRELIDRNQGKLYNLIKPFVEAGYEKEDLLQAARIGLMKAVESFEPERNVSLLTYLERPVLWEISEVVKKSRRPDQLPWSDFALLRKIAISTEELRKQGEASPSLERISAWLQEKYPEHSSKYAVKHLEVAQTYAHAYQIIELDAPFDEREKSQPFGQNWASPVSDDNMFLGCEFDIARLDVLVPSERRVVMLAYGFAREVANLNTRQLNRSENSGLTCADIGKLLGISLEIARKNLHRAMEKLKNKNQVPYQQWLSNKNIKMIVSFRQQLSFFERELFDLTYLSWVGERLAIKRLNDFFDEEVTVETFHGAQKELGVKIAKFFLPLFCNKKTRPQMIAKMNLPYDFLGLLTEHQQMIVILSCEFELDLKTISTMLGETYHFALKSHRQAMTRLEEIAAPN